MKPSALKTNILTVFLGIAQIYAWATTYYIPAAIMQIVPNELHQNSLWVMGGISWALFVGGVFAPQIGAWIEAEGGRRPLTLGNVLMGLGLIGLSQTYHLFLWYVSWTLIGLGMALGLFNALFATIGRLLGQEAKKVIIRITLISGFATLLWPVTTYLIQMFGWRQMLIIYAIPHLVLFAPSVYLLIPSWIPKHETSEAPLNFQEKKKLKLMFYILASYIVLRSIVGTTISIDILAMLKGLGLVLSSAAFVAALIGPSQIAGRILELYFGQRFSPIHSAIFWTLMLPLSILALLFIGEKAAPIFSIIYGMSNGVLTITMGVLPLVLFGANGYAKRLGNLAMPTLIAQSITPLLLDPLIQSNSSRMIFTLCGILGIFALLSMVLLYILVTRSSAESATEMVID